jgi:hypothetical protein
MARTRGVDDWRDYLTDLPISRWRQPSQDTP